MEIVTSGHAPGEPSNNKRGSTRPSANYHPTIWGDYFITHPSLPSACQESETGMKRRVEELIEEVKAMLRGAENPLSVMRLIDALQRLGVDYHFEEEICESLCRIHSAPSDSDDLHETALRFRLLRQHRYNAPSDVFSRFLDDQGNFKAILGSDVKGLLSLYEAAYLSAPGEDVLDKAISFARSHLESMSSHPEPPLGRQVLHALETPLHRRMKRLEARLYITIYEEDEARNDVLLDLAKLDFHLLQLVHREEIRTISMWWKKLGLSTKFSFARDRIVELYFWILGVYFEPHYSRARMMMVKVIAFFSLLDDIYDAYGTLDELQQYTSVIQRWSLEDAEQLEECCKLHFHALTSLIKSFEDELAREGLSHRVHYLKEVIKELARAYFEESKWREERHVPSFEDHLQVSLVSTGYGALACASFVGMGEVAMNEAFDWVISLPKIIMDINAICRFMDDVVGYEKEAKREHVACTIHCYMKEHKTSIQESHKKILAMVEDAWKDINQELLNLTTIPMPLLTRILNLARMMETIYKNTDGYIESMALKDYIALLLVQPIRF